MEETKLNFNTPLMSVRRFSTPGSSSAKNFLINRRHTLPSCNSDSNMDQVTEPVAVPFLWEQIPGIARDGIQAEPQPLDQVFEKASDDQVQIPGSLECFTREGWDEMEETGLEDDNDDNDVYSDALETLSPAESLLLSFNCSVSGLSGSDGLAHKPSGTFSVDPQTRDLMMSRFLPAARAMALEHPQYTSRKQQQLAIVPYERPKEVKRKPDQEIKMLPCKYDPNIIQTNHEEDKAEEDGSEDENEIDDEYGIVRGKGCGLIPKLCLLNPIPVMKIRTHNSLSVKSEAKKLSKDGYSHAKTAPIVKDADYSYGSDRGTVTSETVGSGKLPASGSRRFNFSGELQTTRGSVSPFRRSRTGPLFPQKNFEYQQKSDPAAMSPKLHGLGTKHFAGRYCHFNYSGELRPMRRSLSPYRHSRADALPSQHDAGHGHRLRETPIPKLRAPEGERFAGVSRHFNLSGELQTLRGSVSPYRHSRNDAFSTPKIERSQSPLAGAGVLGSGREVESITNNGSNFSGEARKDRLLQASYGVERTVYVDSVNVAKNSHSNLRTSDQEVWMDPEAEGEDPVKRRETEEASSGFKSSEYSNSSISRELILISDQKFKEEEKVYLDSDSLPPLLKSPSESWLYRTLPSIPSRSLFAPKKQSPKLSSHETKWETIVKSSNLRYDHVRYSEELVTHATQEPKSKF